MQTLPGLDSVKTLSKEQQTYIEFLPNKGEILQISGPAGTGKTLVAYQRAKLLATSLPPGSRILFLCYNKVLKEYLSYLVCKDRLSEKVRVNSVYAYFRKCLFSNMEWMKKRTLLKEKEFYRMLDEVFQRLCKTEPAFKKANILLQRTGNTSKAK